MNWLLRIRYLGVFFCIASCSNNGKNDSTGEASISMLSNAESKIEVRVFKNDTIAGTNLTGFGYNIMTNGNSYIHQPHIPAISGLKGFSTEEDARRVGEYVSKKIEMTNALPVITSQELDSLGILY